MRILFTSGGSGGHIYPLMAVAKQLKKTYSQNQDSLEMYFLGSEDFSLLSLRREGIKTQAILSGKIRRYLSFKTFVDLLKMPIGFAQALFYLYIWMPDVIFSKGGYASVPVILAGWIYRIPSLIHESDFTPGLANRLAAKFAARIGTSFKESRGHFLESKTAFVGNPIRENIIKTCLQTSQEDLVQTKLDLGLGSKKPVVLILGGSQGASKINELVLNALGSLVENYQIIHQCGEKNYRNVLERSRAILGSSSSYHLYSFLEEEKISKAYLVSDLVVSRAGAGSIFEIAICAKPSILIPIPKSANNHQKKNAFACNNAGMSVVLDQANLTPHLFLNEIKKILEYPEVNKTMSENAKKIAYPESSKIIADSLIEMAK